MFVVEGADYLRPIKALHKVLIEDDSSDSTLLKTKTRAA
jgi:hypothetical protein